MELRLDPHQMATASTQSARGSKSWARSRASPHHDCTPNHNVKSLVGHARTMASRQPRMLPGPPLTRIHDFAAPTQSSNRDFVSDLCLMLESLSHPRYSRPPA